MLNVPCCAWTVEGVRFNKAKYSVTREEVADLLGVPLSDGSDDTPSEEQRGLLRSQMLELGLGPPVDAPVPRKGTAGANGLSKASTNSVKTPTGSRNVAYLSYVSHLHLQCGWLVEKEALRIPSTKNWGVVSTRKVATASAARGRVKAMIQGVGGGWKARSREGEGKWFLSAAEKGNHEA
jgi:tRNASer (uridine44-2'-O)-methyltransferase